MIRRGTRVKELTQKVGQIPRTGKVIDIRDDVIEVAWDNGHTSSVSGGLLVPLRPDEEHADR